MKKIAFSLEIGIKDIGTEKKYNSGIGNVNQLSLSYWYQHTQPYSTCELKIDNDPKDHGRH